MDISRGVVQDRGMAPSSSRGTTMVTPGNKDSRGELGMANKEGVMDSNNNNSKHNNRVMEVRM